MSWKHHCLAALSEANLFENSGHRTRFKELMDCYSEQPFFTRGLCKCMYLSAWDEEHFFVMLETLSGMSLGKEQNTEEMRLIGDALAEEQATDEYYVYMLSIAFLDNIPYPVPDVADIRPETIYIIQQAQKAAEIIDGLH